MRHLSGGKGGVVSRGRNSNGKASTDASWFIQMTCGEERKPIRTEKKDVKISKEDSHSGGPQRGRQSPGKRGDRSRGKQEEVWKETIGNFYPS